MFTVLLCVFLFACVYKIGFKRKTRVYELPPILSGSWPLIGHTHLLLSNTTKLWQTLQDSAKEAISKGGIIHCILGRQTYYLIADTEDALTISNMCLQRHFAYSFVKPWLGEGLVTSAGETWKRHRKLLNPAFSMPVIYGFVDLFNSQVKKLINDVKPHDGKEPFDPTIYLNRTILETFCVTTFGIDEVEDKNITENYMSSERTIMSLAVTRFQNVWLHNDILYSLSGLKKKEQSAIENLRIMSDEIIKRKKAALKSNTSNKSIDENKYTGIKHKSLLDLLLYLAEDGTLTDKEIRDEIDTMIAAGFDTISNQILYTIILLGSNPDVQNKMYDEILQVLGHDRDLVKEDLGQLVYTNAVIMESIRLLPAVPLILRYIDRDVKLKNYTIPADSQCLMYSVLNTSEALWGPSAEKFLPERWLDNAELLGKKDFAGFGIGKRGCIGRQYAMVLLKVFLAQFFRQYKVTANVDNLKVKFDFVLKPVAGYEISVTRRR